MENKIKINNLKEFIQHNESVYLYDFLKNETNKIIDKLSSAKYLEIKEHPDHNNIKKIIESYENDISLLIEYLTVLCKFRDNNYFDIINEIIDIFISMKKNEKDGYGYIWRNLSNYPLLLIIYCLGISFLKHNNIDDLFKILNKDILQRYADINDIKTFKTPLIEGINSYHVFNNIDNMTVDVSQYLPVIGNFDPGKQSYVQMVLNANNRIFEYLSIYMTFYFRDRQEFSDYFDLYEFLTGLIYMDLRQQKKVSLKFSPYGRNYRIYSGSGRYFVNLDDTLVYQYINDANNKNNILTAGFFDGKNTRFEKALIEYKSLLSQLN